MRVVKCFPTTRYIASWNLHQHWGLNYCEHSIKAKFLSGMNIAFKIEL